MAILLFLSVEFILAHLSTTFKFTVGALAPFKFSVAMFMFALFFTW